MVWLDIFKALKGVYSYMSNFVYMSNQRSFSSLSAQNEHHNNHIHLNNSDLQEVLRAGPVIVATWVSRRMQVDELACREVGSKMKALTVQARVDESESPEPR